LNATTAAKCGRPTLDILEAVQSILALQVEYATELIDADPSDFGNGYRAGVLDCLGLVNELANRTASKLPATLAEGEGPTLCHFGTR